jgi:hypothetical protein
VYTLPMGGPMSWTLLSALSVLNAAFVPSPPTPACHPPPPPPFTEPFFNPADAMACWLAGLCLLRGECHRATITVCAVALCPFLPPSGVTSFLWHGEDTQTCAPASTNRLIRTNPLAVEQRANKILHHRRPRLNESTRDHKQGPSERFDSTKEQQTSSSASCLLQGAVHAIKCAC